MRYLYLTFFTGLLASSSLAQNSPQGIGTLKDLIVYQSPNNGDTYVPERTTLIVRPAATIVNGHSSEDFSFDVRGEFSGIHLGKVLTSDDNETIIFKPYLQFNVNERVDVIFLIHGMENFAPIPYSFYITSITEKEQLRRLRLFRESEKTKNITFLSREIPAQANDTIPTSKFILDTIVPEKISPGYIFMTKNVASSFLETLNNQASVVFERQLHYPICENFRPWPNKKLSYINNNQVILLDSNYALLDSFLCGNGYITDDHEFQLLPNGHCLLMANDIRDTDLRTITGDSNSLSHGQVIGGIIQELDTLKNVVFQWRTWDHFKVQDAEHLNIDDPNITAIDYCHLNSIEQDTDGNLIASFRTMDEVTKINRQNGNIIWRWGGKNSVFTFVGDTLPFTYQHDVRRIANGHITMMDNGDYRSSIWGNGSYHDTAWSRAIEYELDETNHTARAVWQYRNIDFTPAAGNVQRLSNGNTFINSGGAPQSKAVEVTPDGEKVFQLSYPIGDITWRAFRFSQPAPPLFIVRLPGATSSFEFGGIYPNPAQNVATVIFSLQNAGDAEIDLLDVLGHTVRSIKEKILSAGSFSADLDVRDLAEGIYYCKLSQNGSISVKTIIVQK